MAVFMSGSSVSAEGMLASSIGGEELMMNGNDWMWVLGDTYCLKKNNVKVEYYINFDDDKPCAHFNLIDCNEVQLPHSGYLKLIPSVDGKKFVTIDLAKMDSKLVIFVSKADNRFILSNCPQYGMKYMKTLTLINIEGEDWTSHKKDFLENVNY